VESDSEFEISLDPSPVDAGGETTFSVDLEGRPHALWTVPWFTFGPGMVTLPFAGLLTWALGRHAPHLRDIWGLPFGVGGFLAFVALGNLGTYVAWLIAGSAIALLALVAYVRTGQTAPRVDQNEPKKAD
jgi:hypothetical protein